MNSIRWLICGFVAAIATPALADWKSDLPGVWHPIPFTAEKSAMRGSGETGAEVTLEFNLLTGDAIVCPNPGLVGAYTATTPVEFSFEDESTLRIRYGLNDMQRTVHLDRDAAPDGTAASEFGYSVLVPDREDRFIIRTSHMLEGQNTDETGTPLSADAVIEERYRIDSAANGDLYIVRDVSYDDPAFAEQVPAEWSAFRKYDIELIEQNCAQ